MNCDMPCPLCHARAVIFEQAPDKYYQCSRCSAIFLAPELRLSPEAEKERYLLHNNDIEDLSYQRFVGPIVGAVEQSFDPQRHQGLDFGAGTGPVIAKLLRDKGYVVELYDPFFFDQPEKLERTYDFIVCCEVVEHFYFPNQEFLRLKALLKPGGTLICMTCIYSEEIDFKSWHYRSDPTHVIFYHRKTLEWIRSHFGFSAMKQSDRLVQFFI